MMENADSHPSLSILIPVYNQDVRALVADLHQSASAWGGHFEIRVADDGSAPETRRMNASISSLPGVAYREMPHNVGRSAIRNALISWARYPYLILMDADSAVVRPDYVSAYMREVVPDTVICGGRTYAPERPSDPSLHLHWRYGRRREQRTAAQRNAKPWHGFQTNNYLIPADIAKQLPFDEQLVGYGHEDSLFGLRLQESNIAVHHIDNPLCHLGLERADVFLDKHSQAINNLTRLYHRGIILPVRLMDIWIHLHALGLAGPTRTISALLTPLLKKNLMSSRPSLYAFDLYRLGQLLERSRNPL
jgi:glycosyltransferase involved in cell wall biosynthesis